MRVECEAVVVGEQGGEGDQVRGVTVPVALEPVMGGAEGEAAAAAAAAAVVTGAPGGGVAAVYCERAERATFVVELGGFAQSD